MALVVFVAGLVVFPVFTAHAATFSSVSVSLSDPRPGFTSNYSLKASSVSTGIAADIIKCIKVSFSANSDGTGTIGNSFTAASATVNAGASTLLNGATGTWTPTAAANSFTYVNAGNTGQPSTTSGAIFELDGIFNATVGNTSYWYSVNTYDNSDCATSPIDNAITGFIFTAGSTLSLTVNDTLSFTVNAVGTGQACDGTTTTAGSTATTIPFGTVTSAANAIVCQDLTAATNAANGYTIYARYTAKPTNALTQTIQDVTNGGSNTAPAAFTAAGVEGYGYSTNSSSLSTCGGSCNANRFTNPSQNWAAMTTTNAEVAYTTAPSNSTTVRVGHQVGVATVTKPGTYTTTIIYTCTPVY